jgi:deazaflavin-dependent oxidoreductase (nitroreductase family)
MGQTHNSPRAAAAFRFFNPIVRRIFRAGVPSGPNILLTVRGRTTGLDRTFPIAMLQVGDRRFVQASFGEVNWVRNIRASGQAVVTKGRRSQKVEAIELAPEIAGPILRDTLARYHRSRLLRALLGGAIRPPAGAQRFLHVRTDDTLEDYVAEARRHPVFELVERQERVD